MTAYTTTAEDARRFNVRQARREHFARVAEERLGRKRRAPYTRTHYPEDEEFDMKPSKKPMPGGKSGKGKPGKKGC